jgi:hypothetical protein
MRFVTVIGVTMILTTQVQATVPEYCAAYARDFADLVKKQDPKWQRRYDNAQASCLLRFTSDAKPAVKEKSKTKQAVSKKPTPSPAPVEAAPPELFGDADPAPVTKAKVKPKLQAGSPEWTAYCKKKYVSFNEAKGTYLSKTGKERKCLVTAD